jgi:hypothetical protein
LHQKLDIFYRKGEMFRPIENIGKICWQHGIAGLLSWMSCDVTQLERLFTQLVDPVGVLETVLEACPLLERGLGNILASATTCRQGFVSGSACIRINLSCWIRIRIQLADPDPDPGGQK